MPEPTDDHFVPTPDDAWVNADDLWASQASSVPVEVICTRCSVIVGAGVR